MKRRWTLAIVITALMVTCMGFSIALADGGYEDGNYHYLPLPDGSAMIERYDGWTASQIVIPDQIGGLFVSEIGPNAFADHEELVSVSLPDTITIIASNAFDRCISIREIVLPDHLTTLGDYAFAGCMTLERINLPDSLKYVSANPFWACEKLKEIRISASHPALEMIGSALCLKPERKLVTYLVSDGTASYTIPEGIEVVGAGAFRDCKKLKSIDLPMSVQLIEQYAFAG